MLKVCLKQVGCFYKIKKFTTTSTLVSNFKNIDKENNCSKYRFNRLLTKDPSEVTSLEYK